MKTFLFLWREKTDVVLLAGLFLSLFLFYPELFTARMAMLTGDHSIQHYPWAVLLSNSLKHFQLPFWTSALHSGFPITAEGQIGSFYPPNWLFLGLLPAQWGYSYLHVFHFLLAGWGMYGYVRIIKLSPLAAFLTAFVYLFGTVYGGAYYNITSLKTLTWFPWLLFFFECFSTSYKKRFIAGIALAATFSILAGYLQIAVYGLFMFVLYVLLRFWILPTEKESFFERIKKNAWIFFGLAIGVLLSGPQLLLTYDLAMRSTRAVSTEEFAYVGSLFPGALITFFYPVLQGLFRGNCIYIGMLAGWFVLMGFFCPRTRKDPFFKIWFSFGLLALFLALGEWSPLYVLLVKVTHFYSFRTPAKFLFFICFSLSLLVGFGFQRLEDDIREGFFSRSVRWASKVYLALIACVLAGLAFINGLFRFGRPWVENWGYGFVERRVYGKMGHAHTLAEYHQKWDDCIDGTLRMVTPNQGWNLVMIGLMIVGGVCALRVLRAKQAKVSLLVGVLVIFFIDLYAFSWNDLRKDFANYSSLNPSPIVAELLKEKAAERVSRIYGLHQPADPHPLLPSLGMLYGIEDIGAYSPFVTRRYLEVLGPLGNVDDSNGFQQPSLPFIQKKLSLLSFMNVSHILSTQPLNFAGWTLVAEEAGEMNSYLYRNQNPHAKAYFISSFEFFESWTELKRKWLNEEIDPAKIVYLEKSELTKISKTDLLQTNAQNALTPNPLPVLLRKSETDAEVWELNASRAGFFVRSVLYEPKWTCFVNGRSTPVLAANGLFQAVWISKPGTYQLSFRYKPFSSFSKD